MFVERGLDVELHSPVDRCLFYEDPAASFSHLLFYGQEWSLWQLEVLVFAFVDMLATDYVLAAVITFLASRVSSHIRTHTHTHIPPSRPLSLSVVSVIAKGHIRPQKPQAQDFSR